MCRPRTPLPALVRHRFLALALATLGTLEAADSGAVPCTAPGQFGPAQNLVTGPNPTYVLTGDYDEDGLTDLAVATSYGVVGGNNGFVTIVRGNGDGTFQPPVNYVAGITPLGLAAADFNEDGITDLAATNLIGGNISILLGNGAGGVGNGTFAAPVNFAAGVRPFTVVAEDFDEDGILDLAASNNGGAGGVSVLRGQGSGGVWNGTFSAPTFYAVANLPIEVRSADFDEDGILDLAVTVAYAGHVAMMRGQGSGGVGNGTFAAPVPVASGAEPFGLAIADWNADGILDLAVANGSSGGLRYFRGLGAGGVGNGTFASSVLVAPVNCAAAVAADIDQDGKLDLLTAETNSNYATPVLVAYGGGDGTFGAPVPYMAGIIPADIVVGQFDASPRPDIAVANYNESHLTVRLGTCQTDPNAPAITRVRDVPNDQGGRVFVTWTRSALDVSGGSVNNYRVWRRIPPEMAAASVARLSASDIRERSTSVNGSTTTTLTYWEALATLPAQRLEGYGYTAATTQDSMPGSNPYTAFFVTALTSNIDVFYDSEVDSGYSVDNLPPGAPQNVLATFEATSLRVTWRRNGEPDLAGYAVHKSDSPGFVPSPSTFLAMVPDTDFVDASPSPALHYKVIAVDVHGNPSAPTLATLSGPTAALISAQAPVVQSDRVELAWHVSVAGSVEVQRRDGLADWAVLGSSLPDGGGVVRWSDESVRAGSTYEYRLRLFDGATEQFGGAVQISIPALVFALHGVRPNPVTGASAMVRFALDGAGDGRLEVLDVVGRRVVATDVGTLGPGVHTIDLDRLHRLTNGVYVVRLSSGGRTFSTRAIVIR